MTDKTCIMFKVGDTVKGNENHINPLRMDDVGVIMSLSTITPTGCWVLWEESFGGNPEQFALFLELDLVKSAE